MRCLFVLLYTVSFYVSAGCSVSDEMQQEWNEKYENEINIETKLNDSSFYVVINLPEYINNQKFKSVLLLSDSIDKPTFAAPLQTYFEDGKFNTWYDIDAGQITRHFVVASFGEDCLTSVIKEVYYQ